MARSLEDLVRNRQIVGAQVVLGDVARVRLRRGRLEGRKIMGLEQWKEMTRPQSPRNDGGYGFGIGVRVNERGQAIVLSHGGALSGSYSHMIINLENGRYGVVTCSGLADQAKVAAIVATWVE